MQEKTFWKGLLSLFMMCLMGLTLYAQQNKRNEEARLLQQLSASKQGTARANAALKLAEYYVFLPGELDSDLQKSLYYTEVAKQESRPIRYLKGVSDALVVEGLVYIDKRDDQKLHHILHQVKDSASIKLHVSYAANWIFRNAPHHFDTAIAHVNEALAIAKEIKKPSRILQALVLKCEIYQFAVQKPAAEMVKSEIFELVNQHEHELTDIPYEFYKVSQLYFWYGNLDRALLFGINAIKAGEKLQDNYLPRYYDNLGMLYRHMNQFDKAIEYYEKADAETVRSNGQHNYFYTGEIASAMLRDNRPKEALQYVKNALKTINPANLDDVAHAAKAMGDCYKALGQYDLAEKEYIKANLSVDNFGHQKSLGQFYIEQKQYSKARPYIEHLNASLQGITVQIQTEMLLFTIDSAEQQYTSAIDHLVRAKFLEDSISQETKYKQLNELQVKYETEKKDQEIQNKAQRIALLNSLSELQQKDLTHARTQLLLEEQSRLQNMALAKSETERKDRELLLKLQNIKILEQKQQLASSNLQQATYSRNFLVAGAVMLMLLLGVMYNRYRVKKLATLRLESQQEAINLKNIQLERLLTEKELLLKEVHHRVKNNLQTVISLLESQSTYLQNDALNAIKDSQHRVYAMSLIHQKLYQSDDVTSINLATYIPELVYNLAESFDSTRTQFKLEIADVELDVSQAIPIALILNEAITNALKYAFPVEQVKKEICIRMQPSGVHDMELTISDNGKGLPTGFHEAQSKSLGLRLMQGLTGDLNGTFELTSGPGVTIHLIFPIDNTLEENNRY
ncbi:two-component sensor histidine kinase [Chitinophaga skermanii]|uniref:histidine kinase n=1 Tax=Chitinophaga skermanii TaxID=331697 RepID=A0A327R2Z6_9BACT|nr:histidine kinase dimerization/phosphoacceptor domain -containing protein [Chitinophaga skermanii]RAJ11196.1 two-component sensor histidine kinase [Chitinophaga skermanii]